MQQQPQKSGFTREQLLEDLANIATDALDPNNSNPKRTPEQAWVVVRAVLNAIYSLDKLEGKPTGSTLDYRATSGPDAPEPNS